MMMTKHIFGILGLLSLIPFSFAQKSIETVEGNRIKTKKLNHRIEFLMDSIGIPGVSMTIINDKEIVYHETFGVQNVDTKEAISKGNIFEGASLSKPIFAYFAMKMVDKGILDLDQPLYKYFPHPAIDSASQEAYKKITARMLFLTVQAFPTTARARGLAFPLSLEPIFSIQERPISISQQSSGSSTESVGKINSMQYLNRKSRNHSE